MKRKSVVVVATVIGAALLVLFSFYYDPEKVPVQSQYDCIFGFSNGHVGTTTLSDIHSYNNGKVSGLALLFEGSNPLKGRKTFVSQKEYGQNFTIQEEIKFVKNNFAPHLVTMQRLYGARVIMDLGHYNLFYYNGLVEYFTSPKYASQRPNNICKRILFVRIRRPRLETAFSLYYQSSGRTISNICTDFSVNYCPYNNPNAVLLHPPSTEAWSNLSAFQQCLWIIDETNARWEKFKETYPEISVIELFWSSHVPGSLVSAINNISDILGVPRNPISYTPAVNRVHAGKNNRNTSVSAEVKSDQTYRTIMNLETNPFFKLHSDPPMT